ncbi:MaoC/PaaZ C-terminal domain-containing protein [Parahaliea mediterranea]|uniref:MaoC/PaaZ C-terminal domain-containing protein n=1 Tax=Parahaliea mediterranea TaxID=651086 RepID=UPI000E2EDF9C|nr:MaoC/PaaZ C-terminal domain-containing protein [Parahaliea mediterranea]
MKRFWCDLQSGEAFTTGQLQLRREDILAFAAEFDPQPYHLDSEAADASIFGGLCASGWQVTALVMRLLTDTLQAADIPVMGIEAVPNLRWKMPVMVDDTLHGKFTVTSTDAESRQPGCGRARVDIQVNNQDHKPVVELSAVLLIAHAEQGVHLGTA